MESSENHTSVSNLSVNLVTVLTVDKCRFQCIHRGWHSLTDGNDSFVSRKWFAQILDWCGTGEAQQCQAEHALGASVETSAFPAPVRPNGAETGRDPSTDRTAPYRIRRMHSIVQIQWRAS